MDILGSSHGLATVNSAAVNIKVHWIFYGFQGYGFSSGHIWMWELDYKESWALKSCCFWTVVLEKTLESPLDCKEFNQSILKEIGP